ncbi:MAG: hypothetical protein GX077_06895 [Tissierellia bacterium]|nr:hypothetical protein [Tissierellia bacterium]
MLKEVLKEISRIRVYSTTSIANNLNMDEELVKEAIFQLIRLGYIVEDETRPNCDTKCGGCAYSSICSISTIKTLRITDKGKLLLNNI